MGMELFLGIARVFLALLGILAGVLVTRHYYRKGKRKSISPFIHSFSKLLSVDPEIGKEIKTVYKGKEVHDLYDLQVLIANDGEQSVRDCISPLQVVLPSGTEILDYSIVHIHPPGREVVPEPMTVEGKVQRLSLRFPLLNEGDFFILKVLSKGEPDPEKLVFRITADGLPPTLKVGSLADIRTDPPEARSELKEVCFGIVGSFSMLLLGIAFSFATYLMWEGRPSAFPIPWAAYHFNLVEFLSILVVGLFALLFLLIGVIAGVAALLSPFGTRRRRYFPLPAELRKKLHKHRMV